jgi:hypothetical protein
MELESKTGSQCKFSGLPLLLITSGKYTFIITSEPTQLLQIK